MSPAELRRGLKLLPKSQLLQNLTILEVKSRSILNAPPSLQLLSGAPENAPAESESTLLSCREAWEHLELLGSTSEVDQSVWEVCEWLPDWVEFCWCMIDSIGENPDDDAEIQHPNSISFQIMKIGFEKFEWKLQKRVIWHQRYLDVIRNCAFGLIADYEQSVVADEHVAWLYEHNNIGNPAAAGSLANRNCITSHPAANWSFWGLNALAGRLFKDLHCGQVFIWHPGGWTNGWWFGGFWWGFGSLCGVISILLLHYSYSYMNGCVESSRCWD